MAYTIEQMAKLDVDLLFTDEKKRDPGCQCHLEEGDSPCPVHVSIDDIIERCPVGFIHNLRR